MRLAFIIAGTFVATLLPGQTSEQSAESSAKAVSVAWVKAWNTHDMEALADLVDEHVDFITVGGRWLKGRAAFKEHHTLLHKTATFKDAVVEDRGTHVQRLSPDVLLVHTEHYTMGDRERDGTARQPRNGIMTWVLTQSGGRWRIRASHNVVVTIAPPLK